MRLKQLFKDWTHLFEVPLLTSGHDIANNIGFYTRGLIEMNEEYQIYQCCGYRDNNMEFTIKIYLAPCDVCTNPNMHLGHKPFDGNNDEKGFEPDDCFVFEVLEGEYEAAIHPHNMQKPEIPKEVLEDKTGRYTQCVDEDTGEDYLFDTVTGMVYYHPANSAKPETPTEPESEPEEEPLPEEPVEPKGFACVAGMHELKKQLEKEVLFPLRNKDVMKRYKLHPLNGMLLHGNPGCGKTFIAEKFAEESGMNFEKVSSGSLSGKYIHETANSIKEMFDRARQKRPCVLCIDEIDAVCPSRGGMEGGGGADWTESVNEFLSQMNNCSKDGVFVIGTTNNPQLIDEALLRTGRMDKIICIPMPDEECRKEMLEMYLKDRPQEKDIDIDSLANLTDGMTASDIECMVNSVAMEAAYTLSDITYEALAEQARTQRRSGEKVAKTTMKPVAKTAKEPIPRIIGFSKVV